MSFLSWLLLNKILLLHSTQVRRHGGHFGTVPPQILDYAPQERIVLQKKLTGPMPLECISGTVAPQNTACAPSSVCKVSIQNKKHDVTQRRSLRFRAKYFCFWFSPLQFWARTEICTITFRCARHTINVLLTRKLYPERRQTARIQRA